MAVVLPYQYNKCVCVGPHAPYVHQGRIHGWKVEGDQGLGPNTRALAPRTRPKAGLGVGCGRGRPLPLWGYPRKIFENTDAKFCISVIICCEIACFLKTTAKKLGGPIHCWSPNLKVGGTSLPRSLQLLRLWCACACYSMVPSVGIKFDRSSYSTLWLSGAQVVQSLVRVLSLDHPPPLSV